MPLNVLIAPDKFKGTLTADAAARALARGWREARPADTIELLPISDGGDGFGEVMGRLLGAKALSARTTDAAHRACRSRWWFQARTRTALIESANVIGLAMLPAGKFHPFHLDTFGLGAVIRAASARGARRCIIGIGGSATNDAGFGLARALGWKFLNRAGCEIERWTDLTTLAQIQPSARKRWFDSLVVAVDVENRLLGARGATRVFGPQKGLQPTAFDFAERCLRRLAKVVEQRCGAPFTQSPGSGAAGGLGFGLMAFLGARVEPGFELFARSARLERRLRSADLVITGEGTLDRSTLMGKGVGRLARACRENGVPCIGIGGQVADEARMLRAFDNVASLAAFAGLSRAKSDPERWLEELARQIAAPKP